METNNTNGGSIGSVTNYGAPAWKGENATVNISVLWSKAVTTLSNATHHAVAPGGWTPWLAGATALSIMSFLLNLIALIFQCLPQIHVSPFTIYLIVIFITNILYLSVVRPLRTLQALQGSGMFGHSLCVLFMYFNKIVSIMPPLSHVLISLDRLWAIQSPFLYRQYHNKKAVILVCTGMVAYVHLVPFPAFLVDLFYFNPPGKIRECPVITGAMLHWNRAEFVLDRLIPVVIVIAVYIYIIVKRWQYKGGNVGAAQMNPGSSVNAVSAGARVAGQVYKEHADPQVSEARRRKKVKPFMVLTLTSISVFVCWIPADVYWFFMALNMRLPSLVFSWTSTLFSLQMVFDPLMWYFSLR